MIGWIRVVTTAPSDPKVFALADALRIPSAHALGLLVGVMCELPSHAPTGDLSAISPRLLERWAGWEGESGAFAGAFTALFLVEGVWAAWAKHNGQPIAKAERDAERKRVARAEAIDAARAARAADRGQARAGRADGAGTRRDETRRDELLRKDSSRASAGERAETWLTPWFEAYTKGVGAIPPARLAKIVAPLKDDPHALQSWRLWCSDGAYRVFARSTPQGWALSWRGVFDDVAKTSPALLALVCGDGVTVEAA